MVTYPASVHERHPLSGTSKPDVELRGHRLILARITWMLLFAANLVGFSAAVVAYIAAVKHPCAMPSCLITPAQAAALKRLGISLNQYAVLSAGLAVVVVLAGAIMALSLFWRSRRWIALVVGLFLVIFPIGNFSAQSPQLSTPMVAPAIDLIVSVADLVIGFSVLMIFPDGRFVPRWTWILVVAWVVFHVALSVATVPWLTLGYPMLYLSALAIQVYRYRRASDPRQRQQTKVVVLGFIITLLANIVYWIALPALIPALQRPDSLYPLAGYPLYLLITIILPISLAIAIHRFQLFDVDVLINRTLVYGSLTLLLAALYFGSVIGMQHLAAAIAGPRAGANPLIIVVSTLLIAAIFTPLRHRLQRTIDRRFYRAKYDTTRTLEHFAATLRSEVDLNALSGHLVAVVDETMQPAHVSLWLRPA
ncbi:MAG TPA: hypothetical protein VF116_07445 [Ktedonobacterales bacterium]